MWGICAASHHSTTLIKAEELHHSIHATLAHSIVSNRLNVSAFLLTASISFVAPCLVAQSPELTADRAHRDPAIHWPATYNPSVAPVFSHNELLLHTTCHHAFTALADVPNWPNWFLLTKDVVNETPGNTGQGALYRLKIFNTPIQSRIVEFVPDQRLSWIPFGTDETETRHGHFHAWHFLPERNGCRVITEETGISANDRKDPAYASHFMHKAHDLWLASLRYTSEP